MYFLKHAVQDTRTFCCIPVLTEASQRSHWFLNDIRMSEVVRAHNIIQFHFQECLSHPSYTLPPNRRVPVVLNRAITWCNSWQSHSTTSTAQPNMQYHITTRPPVSINPGVLRVWLFLPSWKLEKATSTHGRVSWSFHFVIWNFSVYHLGLPSPGTFSIIIISILSLVLDSNSTGSNVYT